MISSGLTSSRSCRPGTSCGAYSPITWGAGLPSQSSSSSSSSIVLRSTIGCRPATGLAYGLPSGVERCQTSAQPIRRSAYCGGATAAPNAQTSISTRSMSVRPRRASASITAGCRRSTSSASWKSASVIDGCSPDASSAQDATRSSASETVPLKPRPSSRFQQTMSATRGGAGSAVSSSLAGSCRSITANRQPSVVACSRRTAATAARISCCRQRIERVGAAAGIARDLMCPWRAQPLDLAYESPTTFDEIRARCCARRCQPAAQPNPAIGQDLSPRCGSW